MLPPEASVPRITWQGPLTLDTVEALPALVRMHLAEAPKVWLDLSQTPYLDSTALGTLVDLLEDLPAEAFTIAGAAHLWRVLELVGLTDAYPGRILPNLPESSS